MGNGNGGFPTTEENARILVDKGGMRMSPFFIPMILPNMAAANVSRVFGLKGYTSTVITACAAGNQAIGDAAEAIRRGAAHTILGGGCEAGISQLGLGGFNIIKALTRQNDEPEKASRPFDASRDGFVPAEGAAFLVLESLEHALDRGADIVSGGTDTHLALIDLRPLGVTGKDADEALERASITCNKNGIPFDPLPPTKTSGIRVGSPAGTTRGFGKAEFQEIGDMVADVLDGLKAKGEEGDPAVEADVKRRVEALCDRFPIYGEQ